MRHRFHSGPPGSNLQAPSFPPTPTVSEASRLGEASWGWSNSWSGRRIIFGLAITGIRPSTHGELRGGVVGQGQSFSFFLLQSQPVALRLAVGKPSLMEARMDRGPSVTADVLLHKTRFSYPIHSWPPRISFPMPTAGVLLLDLEGP